MPNFREGRWKVEFLLIQEVILPYIPVLTKQESNMTHTQVLPNKQMMSCPQSLNRVSGWVGGHHCMSVPDVITYVSGSGSFSFWDFCGP